MVCKNMLLHLFIEILKIKIIDKKKLNKTVDAVC